MGSKVVSDPTKPLFNHDCTKCLFLGTFEKGNIRKKRNNYFDMYLCIGTDEKFLEVRYGNESFEVYKKRIDQNNIPELIKKKIGLTG